MIGMIIALTAIIFGTGIPLTAIITTHNRSKLRMQLDLADKEIELEKLRLATFERETEKLRLELNYEKQALLEMEDKN
ncbi:hypothetical protein [Bacillus ndiopicus]|uniref:hypothetical protein n=1 Tax=Bacillus ndiopicus TaxID=1347368 RepID=UPI0006949520|nr:hypothetical protein [Bacillus ndiopicus]